MYLTRTFLSELHSWQWLGTLLARLAVGLLFFLSGRGKLFLSERREQMRQTLIEAHVPFPNFNTVFVSTVEFVCGLLLVLGALTPLACAMLGCLMIMAIATTAVPNIKASSPLNWLSEFLYLPEVLYSVILIWLFFSGPGWLSVDHLIDPKSGSSDALSDHSKNASLYGRRSISRLHALRSCWIIPQ
jgi:putative oxidoreductase